jgi:hypothetical protein
MGSVKDNGNQHFFLVGSGRISTAHDENEDAGEKT